jgi:TonB family protein
MVRANVDDPADFPFLLNRSRPRASKRTLGAGLGSLAIHAAIVAVLFSLPERPLPQRAPVITADLRKAVKLVAPRVFDLTQKDPNRGKVTRELDVRSALPAPQPQAPRYQAPPPIPGPPALPAPTEPIAPPEPPKIEIAAAPTPTTGAAPQLPPPPEKPKLAFERVGGITAPATPPKNPVLQPPKSSVQQALRAATQPTVGGGIVVGDLEEPPNIGTLGQIPSPGRMASNLQLLSDPSGVDFKPYLIQVLTAVRHNWLAVIPESARMGRRGQVLIQFIIDRRGQVPKLVIASPSGTEAFDRAAVAGISASYPFPALPAGYKGDEIRLQLAFSYNMAR